MALFIKERKIRHYSMALAKKLKEFQPQIIVYIENGGRIVGETISEEMHLPLFSLDIRYPFSRLMDKTPWALRPLLLFSKEIFYRFSSPTLSPKRIDIASTNKIALVDDSASSGKTLKIALDILKQNCFESCNIQTAVVRCGKRALPIVDHYALMKRAILIK